MSKAHERRPVDSDPGFIKFLIEALRQGSMPMFGERTQPTGIPSNFPQGEAVVPPGGFAPMPGQAKPPMQLPGMLNPENRPGMKGL